MKQEETNTDEAQKADVSQNEVESPATEAEGMEIIEGPISDELKEQARPSETEGEEVESESTEEDEAEATPEETPETPKEGRKTAEARIKKLNAEKKEAEEKARSLADQVKELTTRRPEETYTPPTMPSNTADNQSDEITVEELMRRQKALVDIELARERNINRVNQEATEAINAHPELNPDSESFDKELSESVSQAVLAKIMADPSSDVKSFVGSLMKPYKRSLEKQEAGQKETISKQVSQQATRPTSVQKQEKPFSELSIKEMEEKLGVAYR